MLKITIAELKEIVELVNTVPDEYRPKCFELLLNHALSQLPVSTAAPPTTVMHTPASTPLSKPFILPIDVKAFLTQYGLDESLLWKFFLVEDSEIRPIYQLKAAKKAAAEIQHALMMCLETAISTGQFQVAIESLRTRCQDQKCYDLPNFMKNINYKANLFKAILEDQPLILSPEGKSELAELLEKLKV